MGPAGGREGVSEGVLRARRAPGWGRAAPREDGVRSAGLWGEKADQGLQTEGQTGLEAQACLGLQGRSRTVQGLDPLAQVNGEVSGAGSGRTVG